MLVYPFGLHVSVVNGYFCPYFLSWFNDDQDFCLHINLRKASPVETEFKAITTLTFLFFCTPMIVMEYIH